MDCVKTSVSIVTILAEAFNSVFLIIYYLTRGKIHMALVALSVQILIFRYFWCILYQGMVKNMDHLILDVER